VLNAFGGERAIEDPEPSEAPTDKIVPASGEPLRLIPRDDGGLRADSSAAFGAFALG
jgi:hypothetical protein